MAAADITSNNNAQPSAKTVIGWRYSLARRMSNSALVDIYWTRDLEIKDDSAPDAYVLLLKINPALTHIRGFEDTLRDVLESFNSSSQYAVPHITDSGNDNGVLWLVTPHTKGMLLSEQFSDLGKGIKLKEAKKIAQQIAAAKGDIAKQAYGFLEPEALQFHDDGIRFLNAPVVKALRLHLKRQQATHKLTLNSGYISPSVAVGDVPQPSDDVFSLACITYHLLGNRPPFGQQYVLEAVVHGEQPQALRRVRKPAMEALWDSMSFQANLRPKSMDKFTKRLISYRPLKLILPLAAAASLGGVGFAASHLATQAQDFLETQKAKVEAANAANQAAQYAAATPTVDATNSNEASTPNLIPPAPKLPLTVDSIRTQLDEQIALGEEAKFKPVMDKVRIIAQDGRNKKIITALVDKLVAHELSNARNWVAQKEFEKASKALKNTTKWARSYGLQHHLTNQADLEKDINQYQERQQRLAYLYKEAQGAYGLKQYTPTNNYDHNSARYLNELLRLEPEHEAGSQLLAKLITQQQSQASKALKQKNLDLAYDLLDDTASLINYHNLDTLKETQKKLQARYDRADKKATRVAQRTQQRQTTDNVAVRPTANTQQQFQTNYQQRLAQQQQAHATRQQPTPYQADRARQQQLERQRQQAAQRQAAERQRQQQQLAQRQAAERQRQLALQHQREAAARQQQLARQREQQRQQQIARQREAERQRQLALQRQQQYAPANHQGYNRSNPVVIDPFAGSSDLMEVPISVIDNGYQ